MHDDELTPEQIDELGALLLAERPRPSAAFAEQLDARVADRFARPATPRAGARTRGRWHGFLQRPLLPAAAAGLAVALVAVALVLGGDDGLSGGGSTSSLVAPERQVAGGSTGGSAGAPEIAPDGGATANEVAPDAAGDTAAPQALDRRAAREPFRSTGGGATGSRKVERSASLLLGVPAERIDAAAQGVLGVVARYDGIVDQSNVSSGAGGGSAQFALRIPAARLQAALAALSRLPDAHVLSRTDDAVDVNQAYVSARRLLANAEAERRGVLRALEQADSEDETLRLRTRLDELERTIALAEQRQRALDRRVDYSRVAVELRSDDGADVGGGTDDGSLTIGSAFDDALRVLEVAAGVLVIATAAMVPFALLLACGWPLARMLRRHRREQALDTA